MLYISLAWLQVHDGTVVKGVSTLSLSCHPFLMHMKALAAGQASSKPPAGCAHICSHNRQQASHSQLACDVSMMCRVWRSMAM